MKKSSVKFISAVLAVLIAASMLALGVYAESDLGKVHVVIKNDRFSVADSAAWDGVLCDEWTELDVNSTMATVVKSVLEKNSYSYTYSDWDYFQSINGLSEFDNNNSGGWMGTLNDWFTSEGFSSYNVSNGKLENGDEIVVMYTNAWGADVGSLWGDSTTTLNSLAIEGAALDVEFDSAVTEYTAILSAGSESVKLSPEAFNKNYQVRVYKNEYTPEKAHSEYKRTAEIPVADGDTLYIGVGNQAWDTMNAKAEETVYTVTIKAPVKGDLDGDGVLTVNDVTVVQKHIAGMLSLSDSDMLTADFNNDKLLNIHDATAMQKKIAGVY